MWQAPVPGGTPREHHSSGGAASAGLHLEQRPEGERERRPSVLVTLSADGRLLTLQHLDSDEEIAAAVPAGLPLAVDAPLAVPNDAGSRDAERVLAWLDVPVFPSARRRLLSLYGGIRGEDLRATLAAQAGRVVESLPDATLRQLARERDGGPGADDLLAYRESWLAIRAPRYRPKGPGRADARGCVAAAAILASAVDLAGWTPRADAGDWETIADAAAIDAIACAVVAGRLADTGRSLVVGDAANGEIALAADAAMRARAAVNLARLRSEGRIRI